MDQVGVEIQVTLKRKDYFKLFGMVMAANIVTYLGTVVVIEIMKGLEANEQA